MSTGPPRPNHHRPGPHKSFRNRTQPMPNNHGRMDTIMAFKRSFAGHSRRNWTNRNEWNAVRGSIMDCQSFSV